MTNSEFWGFIIMGIGLIFGAGFYVGATWSEQREEKKCGYLPLGISKIPERKRRLWSR